MSTINKRKKHFIPNFEARSVLLVAGLALASATAANAQTTAAPVAAAPLTSASAEDIDAAFTQADVNKGRKLDEKEAEMMPAIAERFTQLDAYVDGFVSREEFGKAIGF